MEVLKVENLSKNFGGLMAVSNINFSLQENEIIGLIGPNGAGKTTLFNLLTGVYEPSTGNIEVLIDGKYKSVLKEKPHNFTKFKIARTFQNIRLFKSLTVLENVKVAINTDDLKCNYFDVFFRSNSFYKFEDKIEEIAYNLLKLVNLEDKANVLAYNLPYGEQRKLEIVRALACKPKILFLDEPAAGMNGQETAELSNLIKQIKEMFNLTIILIEHDMSLVMTICKKILVLDYGKLIAFDDSENIKNNKQVIQAYLGE